METKVVKAIDKMLKKRKLIIFGAGNNLKKMLDECDRVISKNDIYKVVDNNLCGEYVEFKGSKILIEHPNVLEKIDVSKCFIVITPVSYETVYCEIRNMVNNRRLKILVFNQYVTQFEMLFVWLMTKKPLKNYIVLQGNGDTYENAKAVAKQIKLQADLNKKYKIVWLEEPLKENSEDIQINRNSANSGKNRLERYKYIYYVGRAKYLIFENRMIKKFRIDQKSVYLNHGSFPLKCTKNFIKLPNDIDIVIGPSEFSAEIMSEQYSCARSKIKLSGSPRTDALYINRENKYMESMFGLKKNTRKILWTPTFRQLSSYNRKDSAYQHDLGIPIISSEKESEELDEFLEKNNAQIIIKPHRYQDLSYMKLQNRKNIVTITQDDLEEKSLNVYDIINEMDAYITDYSSIAFDFMLLNKPIIYTIDDMDMYTIGFSVENPFDLMPGEKVKNIEQFKVAIGNAVNGIDLYKHERNKINDLINFYKDGENSKRVCKIIGL